jgi:hypothetical protein
MQDHLQKHPQSEEVIDSYIQTAKRAKPLICLIYQQIGILARDTIKGREQALILSDRAEYTDQTNST